MSSDFMKTIEQLKDSDTEAQTKNDPQSINRIYDLVLCHIKKNIKINRNTQPGMMICTIQNHFTSLAIKLVASAVSELTETVEQYGNFIVE